MLENLVRQLMPEQRGQFVFAAHAAQCSRGDDEIALRVGEYIEGVR